MPQAKPAAPKSADGPTLRRRLIYLAVFGAAIVLVVAATIFLIYNDLIGRLNSAPAVSAKASIEGARVTTLVTLDEPRVFPMGLAADAEGALYLSLFGKNAVKKVAADGALIPWASGLTAPGAIAFGPDGLLYVIDYNTVDWRVAGTLKRITPDGRVGEFGGLANLPLLAGLAVDKNNVVYVSHPDTAQVWRVLPNGMAAPWWTLPPQANTPAQPVGLAYDAGAHALLVADAANGAIYRVDLSAESPEGTLLFRRAGLDVRALALDAQGRVLFANWKHENGQLQRLEADGTITLLAEQFDAPTAILYRKGEVLVVNSSAPGLIEQIKTRLPFTVNVVTLP